MAYRNESADSGRKGAPSKTKATEGYQMPEIPAKGTFLPAYTDSMGKRVDPTPPDQEVGCC